MHFACPSGGPLGPKPPPSPDLTAVGFLPDLTSVGFLSPLPSLPVPIALAMCVECHQRAVSAVCRGGLLRLRRKALGGSEELSVPLERRRAECVCSDKLTQGLEGPRVGSFVAV